MGIEQEDWYIDPAPYDKADLEAHLQASAWIREWLRTQQHWAANWFVPDGFYGKDYPDSDLCANGFHGLDP